ncbi:GPP34 family phosphoprotein [Actinoplanes sp. TFC3]|uniref:GOLPH3/VPS74 family protein n=1 Tax=Actinoplanes sp. TFC3 TaxID=1710355 RepID=UPI00082CB237|nr:GPP34 family phosphoprotein [Actinoplanes sp. TFC3]
MLIAQVPLADDLYLAAHDTVRGRCVLTPATLGLGLSSAVLAELILLRRLDLRDERLVVLDDRPPPDLATTAVLGQLVREQRRGVRDWIAYLSTGVAADLISRRLTRAGLVQRIATRGLFGTRLRYVPADTVVTGRPGSRIRVAAERRELLGVPDLVLAGLVFATGLDQHVLVALDPRGRDHLFDQLRRRLPEPLHLLVGHAEAAVGDAVMARRA